MDSSLLPVKPLRKPQVPSKPYAAIAAWTQRLTCGTGGSGPSCLSLCPVTELWQPLLAPGASLPAHGAPAASMGPGGGQGRVQPQPSAPPPPAQRWPRYSAPVVCAPAAAVPEVPEGQRGRAGALRAPEQPESRTLPLTHCSCRVVFNPLLHCSQTRLWMCQRCSGVRAEAAPLQPPVGGSPQQPGLNRRLTLDQRPPGASSPRNRRVILRQRIRSPPLSLSCATD